MTTVTPSSEGVKKAIRWISDRFRENPAENVFKLINEANIRFDLSPKESEFLIKFYKENKSC